MRIWKEFEFEAGHHLPNLPPEHKCSRPHGHGYCFRLHVAGELQPGLDWVADFGGHMKAAGQLICSLLDHKNLNDVMGNPTAEMIALFIADRIKTINLPSNCRWDAVEVMETSSTGVWLTIP